MDTAEFLKEVNWLYHFNLESTFIRRKHDILTGNECYQLRAMNLKWYQTILRQITPFQIRYRSSLSAEEIARYDNQPDCYFEGLIDYRGYSIPFYDDDYGQQEIAIYEDQTWSGGAYNFEYADEFCHRLDTYLEDCEWEKLNTED